MHKNVSPNDNPTKQIMFIAGENSGDLHGARVITELKKLNPNVKMFGFGGDRMEAQGMELIVNLAQKLPIIGMTQVLKNLGKIKQLLNNANDLLKSRRPDLVVLIDYPGFNLRVSKMAKALNIPVVYYISPQLWAWHKSRIEIIRANVSKMLVIFPFEETMYKNAGINAEFVGHPLSDDIEEVRPKNEIIQALDLDPSKKIIGLIPGSRNAEIVRHLPVMLKAAEIINKSGNYQFVLPQATTIPDDILNKYLKRFSKLNITIAKSDHKSVRAAMDFAICKSGTSTLEFAIHQTPLVVVYIASFLTGFIAKRVLKIPHISLVNIVAQKEVAKELLQENATPEKIANEVVSCMNSSKKLAAMKKDLKSIADSLGQAGASKRTAEAINSFLKQKGIEFSTRNPHTTQ